MNRSRLCVDTCEHIIDMCSSERSLLRTDSYPIWCRTALVCLKWRHRSLFNLYHEVVLEHVHDLDLLLRTLREKPGLAKLVRSLTVLSGRYIPFARTPLPRLLSHGIALNLDAVLYWSNYPPHYVETHLRDFPAMVELRIAVSYIKRPPYASPHSPPCKDCPCSRQQLRMRSHRVTPILFANGRDDCRCPVRCRNCGIWN